MSAERIPVLLLSINSVRRAGRRLQGLGAYLAKMSPKLDTILEKIEIDLSAEEYMVGSFLSSLVYGILFFCVLMFVFLIQGVDKFPIAIGSGLGIWLIFFMLHMMYPSIILKKVAMKENRDLLFALREVMIDVNSGIPLYNAVKNAAGAGYGYISKDFQEVIMEIERGVPEREALKRLAIKTESEYLKRALWQIVNALESGASLGGAIAGIVKSVEEYIYRDIKNYSANLNFLMLVYMFAAAVLPSLGVTFLVLLSAFSNLGVSAQSVSMLVLSSAFIQLIMIGYMSTTRPEIFGG